VSVEQLLVIANKLAVLCPSVDDFTATQVRLIRPFTTRLLPASARHDTDTVSHSSTLTIMPRYKLYHTGGPRPTLYPVCSVHHAHVLYYHHTPVIRF